MHHRLEPEDQARAEFYALLSRLFADAPDASLLAAIAEAPPLGPVARAGDNDGSDGLPPTWDTLRAASSIMDPEAAADEFQTLFVGVGRSEVSLYASHYLGPQSGRPLADLRATLAKLGLARRPEASEYEDHLALVLETMRMLIAGDGERRPTPIADQQAFFERHIQSWVPDCCTAISTNSVANYYRRVAEFALCFVALERDSFAIE
ncbi:MAG: molecular chaperone TorD family protein [Casimicrobiaceae bacterium]